MSSGSFTNCYLQTMCLPIIYIYIYIYIYKGKNGGKIYVWLFSYCPTRFDFKVLSEYKNIFSKSSLHEK